MQTQEAIAKEHLGGYSKETIQELAITPNLKFDTMKSCVEGAGYLGVISTEYRECSSIIALTQPFIKRKEALETAQNFPKWAKTLVEVE